MLLRLTALVCILAALFAAGTASADNRYAVAQRAVCHYFRGYLCTQAMSVVRCETGGTYDIWSGYGKHEYWGLFQMGSFARSHYGHGWNAWVQARDAYRYFAASGRDWSPWSCRP